MEKICKICGDSFSGTGSDLCPVCAEAAGTLTISGVDHLIEELYDLASTAIEINIDTLRDMVPDAYPGAIPDGEADAFVALVKRNVLDDWVVAGIKQAIFSAFCEGLKTAANN